MSENTKNARHFIEKFSKVNNEEWVQIFRTIWNPLQVFIYSYCKPDGKVIFMFSNKSKNAILFYMYICLTDNHISIK